MAVDEAKQDQRGGKSSKRIWAFRFGNMALVLGGANWILSVAASAFGWSIPTEVSGIIGGTLGLFLAACFGCLGLTIPEWFAPAKPKGE